MGGNELDYIKTAFDSNWIAPLGPHVDNFELDLEQFLGKNVRVGALSSGTAALHLALILLGVQQEDEVLCQSFTFSASANPILYQKATPVFVDSEPLTWNISPELLEKAIIDRLCRGKRPKAIIIVHLYGMPAQISMLKAIADKYQIPLIEDAAESLGSMYDQEATGTFGEISALSFNGNKIITTSGGGAIVSKNSEYVTSAKFLATQARDAAAHYEHSHIGYNYRMSNICAGIGRGQMEVLKKRVAQRRKINQFYRESLGNISDITFQTEPDERFFSNFWLTCIVTPDFRTKEKIRLSLEKNNIESRPLWKPMHRQPVFSSAPYFGNGVSDDLFDRGLCLPSGSNLTNDELRRIVRKIYEVF